MTPTPDATPACLEARYNPRADAVVIECWDRDDNNIEFATADPCLLRRWAHSFEHAARRMEAAQFKDEPRLCGSCSGSGESIIGPAGAGTCMECGGSGEVGGDE